MALVINTEPGNTVSVNNDMLFVLYESTKAIDPVTYVDYTYVCDVYTSSGATFVGRLKARPDPTYNRGIFNVSRLLQSVAPAYGLNASGDKVDYEPRVDYLLKFGEEYGGVLYTNLLVDSSNRYAFKSYKAIPYSSSVVIANGLATNMPSTVYAYRNYLYQFIPFFSNVSGVVDLDIDCYDAAGSNVLTSTITNSDFAANKIRQFNGLPSAVSSSTLAIEYALLNGPFNLRVNYMCDAKYPVFTLAWLNPYGGYESQQFGMVSKKSIEIARKSYEQLPYRLNASGEISYDANNVFYGGKKGFANTIKTEIQLKSHLLTDGEYTWLADMFSSPDVYLYDTVNSKFTPVSIRESNYEYRTYMNSRLKPLEFTVELGETYNSQLL